MIKSIRVRVIFFIWGILIAIGGLISPDEALKGILQALKETNKIK